MNLMSNFLKANTVYRVEQEDKKKSYKTYGSPSKPSPDQLSKLQNLRIIQKSLVYVIGLSPQIAIPEVILTFRLQKRYYARQNILDNMEKL